MSKSRELKRRTSRRSQWKPIGSLLRLPSGIASLEIPVSGGMIDFD
jgi:hypothetical protein